MESKILLNRKCVNISRMRGCKKGIMMKRKKRKAKKSTREKQTSKIEKLWEKRILTYKHNTFRPEMRRYAFACYNARILSFCYTIYVHIIRCTNIYISFQMAAVGKNKNFRTWFFASSVFILPVSHLWNQRSHTHSLTHSFFFALVRILWQWSIVCYFGAREKKRKYDHRIHYTCIPV